MPKKRHLFGLFPWFLILYEFGVNLSNDLYVPALTEISVQFGVANNIINLTMTAWFTGAALPLLWIGPLSDRIGRRPVLFASGLLFLASTVICATAGNFWPLFVGRLIQGTSVAGLLGAGYACIHDLYDDKRAIQILAWLGTAAILAPMIGPTIGSFLLLIGPWQLIFWIILVIAALGLVGLWPTMPETVVAVGEHPRLASSYSQIFRNRLFLLNTLTLAFGYAGLAAWIAGSLFVLVGDFEVSVQTYGLLQVPIFFFYFLGAKAIKKFIGAPLRRRSIRIGITVAFVSSVIQIILTLAHATLIPTLIGPMCGFTLGFGMAAAPLARAAIASSRQPKGALTAAFFLCLMAASAAGSLAITLVYNHTQLSVEEVVAAFIALSFVLSFFLSRKAA